VPAYAIVGGNPARVIRYRFTEEQIAALPIRWWDWPEAEVRGAETDGTRRLRARYTALRP
jgi:chloramphenicol O-acetyltransferase type B